MNIILKSVFDGIDALIIMVLLITKRIIEVTLEPKKVIHSGVRKKGIPNKRSGARAIGVALYDVTFWLSTSPRT